MEKEIKTVSDITLWSKINAIIEYCQGEIGDIPMNEINKLNVSLADGNLYCFDVVTDGMKIEEADLLFETIEDIIDVDNCITNIFFDWPIGIPISENRVGTEKKNAGASRNHIKEGN